MNKIRGLFLLMIIVLLTNCSHKSLSIDDFPVIDVNRKYPEKEINLNNIANITYVILDSKNKDFLYRGSPRYITENTIVVTCVSTYSILFFSKDGTPKSRFNRYGRGPEEYLGLVNKIVYDEAADDVFISDRFTNQIQVYSSKGEYKRKLPLPRGVSVCLMGTFDDQSLMLYDESRMLYKAQPKKPTDNMDYLTHKVDSSFFLVSKADGQVLDYVQMVASQNDLSAKTPNGNPMVFFFTQIVKHKEGFLLCNPETDTVFLYNKNKDLIPIISKVPLVGRSKPDVIINNCIDVERYQFFEIQTLDYLSRGERPSKHYMRDKKTGEIFQQKIVIPDYKGKTITISPGHFSSFYENGTIIVLDMFDLQQAYRANRLSGKLKELVASLDRSEENNVYMFVDFK